MNALKDGDVYKRRRLRGILYLFGLIRVCVVYSERQVVLEILQCTQWLWLGFFFKPVKPAHSDGMNTSRGGCSYSYWQLDGNRSKATKCVLDSQRWVKSTVLDRKYSSLLTQICTSALLLLLKTVTLTLFNFTYANHVTTVTKAAPIYNFITINEAIKKILFIVSLSRWSQREERNPRSAGLMKEAALCCSWEWQTAYMWSKK